MRCAELAGGENPVYHPNIDFRELPTVDMVADLLHSIPLPDASTDFLYCAYFIEHIPFRKVPAFLADCARVLDHGGRLTLLTADLRAQALYILQRPKWDASISETIFGSQTFEGNAHKAGFDHDFMRSLLLFANFEEVCITPHPLAPTDMIVEARRS